MIVPPPVCSEQEGAQIKQEDNDDDDDDDDKAFINQAFPATPIMVFFNATATARMTTTGAFDDGSTIATATSSNTTSSFLKVCRRSTS